MIALSPETHMPRDGDGLFNPDGSVIGFGPEYRPADVPREFLEQIIAELVRRGYRPVSSAAGNELDMSVKALAGYIEGDFRVCRNGSGRIVGPFSIDGSFEPSLGGKPAIAVWEKLE